MKLSFDNKINNAVRFLFVISVLLDSLHASSQEIQWSAIFTAGDWDAGIAVQAASDGGYIMTGHADFDVLLIKADRNGNREWTKTFGEPDCSEWGNAVLETADGGFLIAGKGNASGCGSSDIWLIKTDAGGEFQWDSIIGEEQSTRAIAIQPAADGGYIVLGESGPYDGTYRNILLIKIDHQGQPEWSQPIGSNTFNNGNDIQQTSDGGYIVTGSTNIQTIDRLWLVKTNADGNVIWQKTFPENSIGRSIQQTADQGYIITGSIAFMDSWNLFVAKTDEEGNVLWIEIEGNLKANADDHGRSIQLTSDNGYIITGSTSFGAGGTDLWLLTLDGDGNTTWRKTFGESGNDHGQSIQSASDGGYIVLGHTSSFDAVGIDLLLIKLSPIHASSIPEYMIFEN